MTHHTHQPVNSEESGMQNLAAAGSHAAHQSVALGGLSLSADGYVLVAERTRFTAGESEPFSFRIETLDGTIVENFEEEQGGVRMHLIVVRRDLTQSSTFTQK
jgi:hypothetical protein